MFNKIKYTLMTLFTVFKHLFKKKVTLEYPEKKLSVGEYFRGKPSVNGCVKCGTCQKVCPSGALKIDEDRFIFDLKKCIFCGNCSFYCPVKAITMTEDYELASNSINELKLEYNLEGANDRND